MAVILNLHKAVRKIRLDDSEDSPEFTLDLTDKAMTQKAPVIAGCAAVYSKVVDDMKVEGLTDEISQRLMASYHVTIDAFLGDGAFNAITRWLADDENIPPEAMTAVYAPLMTYLYNEYNEIMTVNRNKAIGHYLAGLKNDNHAL